MTTEHAEKQHASPHAPSPGAGKAAQSESLNSDALFSDESRQKPKRTWGLWIMDTFGYALFINTIVFFFSTLMTYLTKHGHSFGEEASFARKVGVWFSERSKPINRGFEKIGVKSEQLRSDFTSVVWSFVDGTIFSFLAKPLEDRREKIAKKIDDTLGTTPDNMRAYDAEPKQSWRSIIEGRFLTSLIVVPTAVLMGRLGGNKRAFLDPGFKFASKVEADFPKLDAWLSKKTIKTPQQKGDFFGYVFFEAFYTSVCTLGLYLMSRTVARKHPKQEKHAHAAQAAPKNSARDEAPEANTPTREESEKPAATVTKPSLMERVAEASVSPALSS